jgi:stringent starvation protein B
MVHPVQSVVESLYAAGRCPRLHVNALCEGVSCPDFIREQWQERLIIDLDSSYPLDLKFDDLGISADLSFGGYVTRCTFPWKAIYVVADRATGRGIVLDQNMPESVRRSRQTPTTGPLQTRTKLEAVGEAPEAQAALAEAMVAEDGAEDGAQDGAQAGPEEATRPEAATARVENANDQPAEAADEEQVAKRRAAFKVIDGGN